MRLGSGGECRLMNALRVVLIAMAAIVFAALGWRLATAPRQLPEQVPTPNPPVIAAPIPQGPTATAPGQTAASPPSLPAEVPDRTAASGREQVEASLNQAPDLQRAFDTLKAQFPAVAERTLDESAAKVRPGGDKPTADDIFATAMRNLRQSSGVLAAKAGAEALSAIFDAQATTLADLAQADPRICADYLYGATSPEYADFAAGHRLLIARTALANIEAMAEGRKLNITRPQPSADDLKLVEDGLAAKGLSPSEIAALMDGTSPDPPLSDDKLCANARTYLDVLHGMPPEPRDRIYGLAADLLARS